MENARKVFDHDFSGENRLIKILFVSQIIAVSLALIGWAVFGSQAANITFILSVMVVLVTIIFGLILFARYFSLPVLVKKKQLVKTTAGLNSELAQIQNKIQNLLTLNKAL